MPTILVIDDEQMLCDLLQEVLRGHGYEIYTASSGREGIESFRRHRPRFTLLDLYLQDMNGIEVLKQIRQIDPQCAVMILTGAASENLERKARDMGVTDFLLKGTSVENLIGIVQRVMPEPAKPVTDQKPPAKAAAPEERTAPQVGIPAPQAAAPAPPAEAPATQPGVLHANSILLVDDEPQILDILTQCLTTRGYRVRAAHDGPTALALVEQERPHLIVLDVYMPGMNGIEVLRKLRAKNYTGTVILLTGSQDQSLLKEALDLGSVDIVGKPAPPEQILLAIEVSLTFSKS
jgi:DNA-binding response OmpR family regulator